MGFHPVLLGRIRRLGLRPGEEQTDRADVESHGQRHEVIHVDAPLTRLDLAEPAGEDWPAGDARHGLRELGEAHAALAPQFREVAADMCGDWASCYLA